MCQCLLQLNCNIKITAFVLFLFFRPVDSVEGALTPETPGSRLLLGEPMKYIFNQFAYPPLQNVKAFTPIMGSTSRLFLTLALLFLGIATLGQKMFSQIQLDQAKALGHRSPPASGGISSGSEESIIPLERSAGVWVAQIEMNDLYQARLIIDTGATYTTISEDLAFDAGIKADKSYRPMTLHTAGGNIKADVAFAKNIRVGNAGRDNVLVVIHTIPNLPDGIDGLLGLSFFDQFMVYLDQDNKQLHLTPKS